MIGQCQRRRDADEQRSDGVPVTVPIDGDDGGCRFAIHEVGEQREICIVARDERLEGDAMIGGEFVVMARPPLGVGVGGQRLCRREIQVALDRQIEPAAQGPSNPRR
jgi:hypothetical protein